MVNNLSQPALDFFEMFPLIFTLSYLKTSSLSSPPKVLPYIAKLKDISDVKGTKSSVLKFSKIIQKFSY